MKFSIYTVSVLKSVTCALLACQALAGASLQLLCGNSDWLACSTLYVTDSMTHKLGWLVGTFCSNRIISLDYSFVLFVP